MGMLGLLKKEPDEGTAPPEEPAPMQNDSSAVPRKRTVTDRYASLHAQTFQTLSMSCLSSW